MLLVKVGFLKQISLPISQEFYQIYIYIYKTSTLQMIPKIGNSFRGIFSSCAVAAEVLLNHFFFNPTNQSFKNLFMTILGSNSAEKLQMVFQL